MMDRPSRIVCVGRNYAEPAKDLGNDAHGAAALPEAAQRDQVYPLVASGDFLLELERVPEAMLRRTRLVYLNYPNNPTAAVAPMEYLERVVGVCRKYGILLAYDNAYCDLTYDGYVAPSIFEVPGAREVAVEFFSLSKSFSMTGWRLGWAAGRAELIGALSKVKSYVDTGPFLALQKAGAIALDSAEALVAPIRTLLSERRDAAVTALRRAGFEVSSPKAAMYLWVPLLALTVSPSRLTQAVARLGRALDGVRGTGIAAIA